jgi:hypothetical protein
MSRKQTVSIGCFVLIVGSGCGAIFNGTRQTITATSAPDAARVVVTPGSFELTTPTALDLERKHEYLLTFSKEGYSPATFQIKKSLQGGIVVLDVLFTGLIGVIIDAATGAWFKLTPETAIVSLTRLDESIEGPETIEVSIVPDGEKFLIGSSESGIEVSVQEKR